MNSPILSNPAHSRQNQAAQSQASSSLALYAPVEPYRSFYLKVDAIHELYVEEVGNPNGQPVVFLHGGPGGGISPSHRRLFDPAHYRIILFDQRGAGQSKPSAATDLRAFENNTTWDLVRDLEKIRSTLNIEKWIVFGGSWGSTLALAYAQAHPDKVSGLILRGIFLCTDEELAWFYQGPGVNWLFPDLWEKYIAPIPETERGNLMAAYHNRLFGPDNNEAIACAKAWSQWEAATCHLLSDALAVEEMENSQKALVFARIENHYFMHQAFLKSNQLINDAPKIRHIPTVIIHGRYDVICPVKNAWALHQALPDAELRIISDAGHAYSEPGILNALLESTEKFKSL
ncbi:MAG: prolyl aminopeptidase [Vampirovibrionales bacterium]|nr:prolyl aminopeptidase [Vampirovibrionales bacterium]